MKIRIKFDWIEQGNRDIKSNMECMFSFLINGDLGSVYQERVSKVARNGQNIGSKIFEGIQEYCDRYGVVLDTDSSLDIRFNDSISYNERALLYFSLIAENTASHNICTYIDEKFLY